MILSMQTHFLVEPQNTGSRLDVFLAEQTGKTRSSIKNLIQNGGVLVNGKAASVHRFLKEGDEIDVQEISNHKTQNTNKTHMEPTVIAETDEWLVIDKPAGLLVHPDAKQKTGTLVDWLLARDPRIGRVGEHPERPGIVHRLDREVSGLMVIAKTPRAYEELQRQFRERKTEKHYLALVRGRVRQEEGEIKFRIARSTSKARMAARPAQEKEGRAAWTHYRVRERRPNATLLDLEIISGRTHQIRAHLQAIGHPIVGDALYITSKSNSRIKAPHLMLQSVFLSFDDPTTGERQSFSLPSNAAFGISGGKKQVARSR